jgi:outer membrane protein TolC
VSEARAAAEANRLAYEQTVLQALREVEDALVAYNTETQRDQTLHKAIVDNRTAHDRASMLYAAGLTDFLNVLATERALYAAEDETALSDLTRVREVIALYKALGGGWQAISFGDENEIATRPTAAGHAPGPG